MENNIKVVIVDYGMGNLFSVRNACEHVGLVPQIATRPEEILSADGVILPGVGAFGDAMANLRKLSLDIALRQYCLELKKPFFGICLGLQLLMEGSYEFGYNTGLSIFKGSVVHLNQENGALTEKPRLKVPQVGWNRIYRPKVKIGNASWNDSMLTGLKDGAFMYFVHSFYVKPQEQDVILSTTLYGGTNFCSSIQRGNMFGCQFHPERSASEGIQIYRNFKKQIEITSGKSNVAN